MFRSRQKIYLLEGKREGGKSTPPQPPPSLAAKKIPVPRGIKETGRVFHAVSQKCLEMTKDGARLKMEPCDASNKFQQWKFKEYNEEKAKEYGVIVP
ncbi:hypothetical protein ANCDUO_12037 [Ancylostoma duodenale]|uniref:Ricin B lectin domain-containing protein n=1 Tax=Ancylostoma duodenale TaxID=51022 RepID=A0A0C2G9X1_9BILA|nr:hypothetical protein ANCDUO_12037 [Ancylostoma duodenale]